MPQITALLEVANALKNKSVGIIADGGIRYTGDMVKALAAGANAVMMGGVFAGTEAKQPGLRMLAVYRHRLAFADNLHHRSP